MRSDRCSWRRSAAGHSGGWVGPRPEPPRGACHLTLTGRGGVGKTRLALQIATELETSFADDLGYFENQYGEQAVFVYDCHSNKAVLYLGDAGWETQHAVVNGAVPGSDPVGDRPAVGSRVLASCYCNPNGGAWLIDNPGMLGRLLEQMQDQLPIPAFPPKEIVRILRRGGIKARVDRALSVKHVFYASDEGGIVCDVTPSGAKDVLIVSLTHLRLLPITARPLNPCLPGRAS